MFAFFDIETFSGEKNTSKVKKNDKTFKPYEGYICAISCLIITRTKKRFHFADGFTKDMLMGEDLEQYCEIKESELIRKFEEFLGSDKEILEALPGMVWIGHNIKGFDLLWMYPRAMKYKCPNMKRGLPASVRDTRKIFDTMSEAALGAYGQYVSLKVLMKFYGLSAKNVTWKGEVMDGSRVHDLFMSGGTEKLIEYVDDDTADLPKLYKIMGDVGL